MSYRWSRSIHYHPPTWGSKIMDKVWGEVTRKKVLSPHDRLVRHSSHHYILFESIVRETIGVARYYSLVPLIS